MYVHVGIAVDIFWLSNAAYLIDKRNSFSDRMNKVRIICVTFFLGILNYFRAIIYNLI